MTEHQKSSLLSRLARRADDSPKILIDDKDPFELNGYNLQEDFRSLQELIQEQQNEIKGLQEKVYYFEEFKS